MSTISNLTHNLRLKAGLLLSTSSQVLFLRYVLGWQLLLVLALFLRSVYFEVAPLGVAQTSNADVLTPWFFRHAQLQKGLELPVFFTALYLACCGIFLATRRLAQRQINIFARPSTLFVSNILLFVAASLLFFPGQDESLLSFFTWQLRPHFLLTFPVCAFLLSGFFQKLKFQALAYAVVVICALVSLSPISLYNYSYVLEPAVRLLSGEPIRSVTSQYDLLLPITAMPFVLGKWDLNIYKICFQVATCIFYLWMIYELAKLIRKEILLLSAFLIVLAKFGFATNDGATLLQISFLRLDLWFPLFILVVRYGLQSKQVMIYLGIIIFLGKTFGSIFGIMYLTYAGLVFLTKPSLRALKNVMPMVLTILFFIALSQILLPNQRLSDYWQYQISFLTMASFSFFWIVAPTFLFCAWIIFEESTGDANKDHAARLLVFLCCGALIYFLGRSHEQNLLNVATPLIFCLGLALDRVAKRLPASIFCVLICCGMMANDVLVTIGTRLDSLLLHGLSPYSAVAAGDFTGLTSEHRVPNTHDGRTIYCFPYSSLEFYFHYHQYGNYEMLPISHLRVCGTILKKQELQEYENHLQSRGLQLQIINSGEI